MRVLVLDMGGTRTKWGLFEGSDLTRSGVMSTSRLRSPDEFMSVIDKFKYDVLVVGFAGLVSKDGTILHSPHLPMWEGVRLCEVVEGEVVVENDANLFLLGEVYRGVAKGYHLVVGVTLGTGVGGAVVRSGELLKGRNGVACEFGHMVLSLNGPACNCGSYGCAETFLGETYFMERVRRVYMRHNLNPPRSIRELHENALGGDPLARFWFMEYGKYLGVFVSNLISAFDPDMVVVGGGISKTFELFKESMYAELQNRKVAYSLSTPVLPGKLGDKAALYGGLWRVISSR